MGWHGRQSACAGATGRFGVFRVNHAPGAQKPLAGFLGAPANRTDQDGQAGHV